MQNIFLLIFIGFSDIILMKGVMCLNIQIDKLTPCLEKVSTGKIVNTTFSLATESDLSDLKGWKFKWHDLLPTKFEIYKLTAENDERIQGLVMLEDVSTDKAVYVKVAESAPHNMGNQKEYSGVGGHLFAIAVTRSLELGYGGFTYMDAKNIHLVNHYAKTLGAFLIGTPHPYRMIIDENAASRLIEYYNFRRD